MRRISYLRRDDTPIVTYTIERCATDWMLIRRLLVRASRSERRSLSSRLMCSRLANVITKELTRDPPVKR